MKLRTRVFDLEQQNRILSLLFQQRVKMSSTAVSQVTTHPACTQLSPAVGPGIGKPGFRRC